jgi:hypothetical protein
VEKMKAKILYISLITGLILLLPIQLNCQTDAIKVSAGQVVYLHTDRSDYLQGESILFKAYLPIDLTSPGSSASRILYVGLIDRDGQEVAAGTFPVQNYKSDGKIDLSRFLTEGKYVLIACTNITKSVTPDKLFSAVISITRSVKSDFFTDIKLNDTLYSSHSNLTANVEFKENDNPVPASFSYKLTAAGRTIMSGKGRAREDGKTSLTMVLPELNKEDTLKLVVAAEYKRSKNITGIIFPTSYNRPDKKNYPEKMSLTDKNDGLNIQIRTNKQQYKTNEKVISDIYVTDDKGKPVSASLSFSAAGLITGSSPHQNENQGTNPILPQNQAGQSTSWHQVVSGKKELLPQIVNLESAVKTGSVFNHNVKKVFAQCLSLLTESPGMLFSVQETNDLKKIQSKKEVKPLINQVGYSNDRNIFQIIRQIKPYQLTGGKIIFASSGVTSLNFQDGALIVIDGVKLGTDAEILNNISVTDIAKINIYTNPSEIQRYTGLNNVGVIEVLMKKGENVNNNEEQLKQDITSTVFWAPDIITDSSGKATVSFTNTNKSSEVIVSVEGMTTTGLIGKNSSHYFVK